MKNLIENWKEKFENYLKENQTDDACHDLGHFRRVWKVAKSLASDEEDLLVILAACYFHDIVNYPKNDFRRSRSSTDAAKKTKEILANMSFPLDKIEHVAHCIKAHSFSANIEPETIEAKVVQDSDRMEALGAIGLARTFYVAGRLGSKIFCSDDPFAQNRQLDDSQFAIDHFKVKLLKLPETMKTESGRVEAKKRAGVLLRFLDDLREEL